jgi:hypothetical protein
VCKVRTHTVVWATFAEIQDQRQKREGTSRLVWGLHFHNPTPSSGEWFVEFCSNFSHFPNIFIPNYYSADHLTLHSDYNTLLSNHITSHHEGRIAVSRKGKTNQKDRRNRRDRDNTTKRSSCGGPSSALASSSNDLPRLSKRAPLYIFPGLLFVTTQSAFPR